MIIRVAGVSLYHQIKQDLLSTIEPLPNGTKIATEQELSERYGVSRGTVRQAISELVAEGHLYKIQGSGTYKGAAKLGGAYLVARTFTDQIRASGKTPGIADITLDLLPADAYVADALHIEKGRIVFRLARTRLVDGAPIAYCSAFIRAEAIPNLQASDLKMSLIVMFTETFHLAISDRRILCRAATASKEIGKRLGIAARSPVLYLENEASSGDFKPMFIDISYFRDNYSLRFDPERM